MPITISIDEKHEKYLRKRADADKRDMGSVVEIALDYLEAEYPLDKKTTMS
jgi:hypothetical protein